MIYKEKTTLEDLEKLPEDTVVVWSIRSCWWAAGNDCWKYSFGNNVPCDPNGCPLLQDTLGNFLRRAKENPHLYGKHGLKSLMAAYEGNIIQITHNSYVTRALKDWDMYNKLIDIAEEMDRAEAANN